MAKNYKNIIRFAGKDVEGDLEIAKALTEIKGIGINLADSISKIASEKMNIDVKQKIGDLNEKQIKELEDIIYHPENYGVPRWVLDRRNGPRTGNDQHITMSNMDFTISQDIQKEKDIKSYRGIRHMFGHKVRGQKTRTTGRRGKTLGVQRKKQKPQKKKAEGKK